MVLSEGKVYSECWLRHKHLNYFFDLTEPLFLPAYLACASVPQYKDWATKCCVSIQALSVYPTTESMSSPKLWLLKGDIDRVKGKKQETVPQE